MSDSATESPWEELPVTYTGTIPRWALTHYREDWDAPEASADEVVASWVENMLENAYDIARDDGRLPEPQLGENA